MKSHIRESILILLILLLIFLLISNLPAQKVQMESILGKVYDLAPKYAVGDKDFYHIRTTYLEMNDSGQVATTRIVDGYFSREILRFQDNKRYDRFVWRHVTIGERKGKGQVAEFKELPYAQDFQYDFLVSEITPEHFPVDIDSIPKTMEGYHFFVNLIDAHTFYIICNSQNYENNINKIGQTARLPGQDLQGFIDFPPLFTHTRFVQAPLFTTFQGITSCQNQPSAIFAFRCDDSRIDMVVNMMNMSFPSDGTSYYWGDYVVKGGENPGCKSF